MAGGDPPPTAPPVAEAPPAVEAPAPATESLGAAPPPPDLEAAEAPPLPAQAPPPTKGWRGRFGKKKTAEDDDPAAAASAAAQAAPADEGSALPPSYPAEGGTELPGERVQVPPRKWPTLSKYLWMGWDSRPWPPVAGAYAHEIPSGGAVAAAAAPAAAAGAAGGAAAAGGGGASWFAWPNFGGLGAGQQEPEAWCKDYVKLGRWASLVFTTWQELCFTSGVHPFTGESMEAGQAGTPSKSKVAAGEAPASAKARGGAAAALPAGAAEVQRCFMQACSSAQDQLARETSGLMLVAVLLAVAAAALIGSLANRQAWNGGDYAAYVLLILSAACSLTHLAIGASVFLAAAGRPAKSFFRLLLSFEPLARAGVASFFAAITTLLAGLLAMAFNAAWSQRDGGSSYSSNDNYRAAVTMVSVLFLALAAIYYIPSYIAGRWMLRCQDKQEGRSRVVSKATLLASLEPLLAWSFADHTIPPAFRTQAEQAGEWEPLRRYCETHSYEVYREFELLPWWQAWPLRVANLLLSTLGPPSLLRLRPTGSPYQFDGLEAPAARAADAAEEKKAAAAAAAAEEEAAVLGGDDVAPPTFSVHVEE